jgi:hypothetical protein
MAKDAALRDNRLALLAETASLFSRIADVREFTVSSWGANADTECPLGINENPGNEHAVVFEERLSLTVG